MSALAALDRISAEAVEHHISHESAPVLLRRMLSLDPKASRTFCKDAAPSDPYRHIGSGACVSVYRIGESDDMLKRAILYTALHQYCKPANYFRMHQKVLLAFEAFRKTHRLGGIEVNNYVQIPDCISYIPKTDAHWWVMSISSFPPSKQYAEDALLTPHIPPLREDIANAFFDIYCYEPLQATARSQISNLDCLIRLYLGARRGNTSRLQEARRCFGLRNFPLCVDQMQDLGLDTASYALVMADALAVMHWSAHIDAAGVDFVLGGALYEDVRAPQVFEDYIPWDKHAATQMYLLDFDKCQEITMDETGVKQAAKRFLQNDPYYPRCYTGDEKADVDWNIFSRRYLEISTFLRGQETHCNDWQDPEPEALPKLFLAKIKERMLEMEDAKRIEAMWSWDNWFTPKKFENLNAKEQDIGGPLHSGLFV